MSDLLRLLRLLGPHWRWQAVGIFLGVIVILTNAGLLALSGWFIAAMGLAGIGLLRVEYFVPAAAIRALAITRTVARYFERVVTHDTTFRLLADLRVWFYVHLEPLAPARLQRHRAGDLLSRIRADIDSLDNFYLRVLAPSISALVCVLLIVGFLAYFSMAVAFADLAGLVLVGIGLPVLAFRAARRPAGEAARARGALRADISDTVRGFEELRIFGALECQTAGHQAAYAALNRLRMRETRIEAAAAGTTLFLVQATMVAALLVIIPYAGSSRLSGPDIAMLVMLVLGSFDAVGALPGAYRALADTMAAAKRIFEIVDTEPAVREPAHEVGAPSHFDITFRDVSFRYSESAEWALRHVNLHIPAGSVLGITGPTGSGKTSLANLLLRFWDWQEGDILIGGTPIRDLSGDAVRGVCTVIAQQTHLFNTSIRENLRIARPSASEAEMEKALCAAGILDEIHAMPEGLDTMTGEFGTQLSGGQARRIAIARAFLKDAPILILDEPTEGLDALSEQAVVEAMGRLLNGRTAILISHRKQALRVADTVLNLDRHYGHVLSI